MAENTKTGKEKKPGFIKRTARDFKKFALKGSIVDLAVAVVIGGAFNKIVSSLVDNIITPAIGILLGGHSFETLKFVVGTAEIKYGIFIQSVIDFLIVSLSIFVIVKVGNSLGEKLKEIDPLGVATALEDEKKPKKLTSEDYLKEIRDLMKEEKAAVTDGKKEDAKEETKKEEESKPQQSD